MPISPKGEESNYDWFLASSRVPSNVIPPVSPEDLPDETPQPSTGQSFVHDDAGVGEDNSRRYDAGNADEFYDEDDYNGIASDEIGKEGSPRRRWPFVVLIGTLVLGGGAAVYQAYGAGARDAQNMAAKAITPTKLPQLMETTTAPPPATNIPPKVETLPAPPISPNPLVSELDCAPRMPLAAAISQQLMLPVYENSDIAALSEVQKQYPTEWIIRSYPKNPDGTYNSNAIKMLKQANPVLPAMTATDQEGGNVARLKGANNDLPSMDQISGSKMPLAELTAKLTTNYTDLLKKNEITVNLAPVVDVATTPGQDHERMVRNVNDITTYLPIFNDVAKKTGINLTYKHFPNLLANGKTDLGPVQTANYDELAKNGVLDAYKLLTNTTNLAMMSSATTSGWPNTSLDNKKINVINPAAYDALNQLTGGKNVIITDDLGPGAKAVDMPPEQAATLALEAGANIAVVASMSPNQSAATLAKNIITSISKDVESGTYPRAKLDASLLKVLGNKGLNACNVLKSLDAKAYTALTASAPKPTEAPSVAASGPVPMGSANDIPNTSTQPTAALAKKQ